MVYFINVRAKGSAAGIADNEGRILLSLLKVIESSFSICGRGDTAARGRNDRRSLFALNNRPGAESPKEAAGVVAPCRIICCI